MYQPSDFKLPKMNSLKYLWIFERRMELVNEQVQGLDKDEKAKMIPKAFFYAGEILQAETGLSEEELTGAMYIGAMLAEYKYIVNLETDDDVQEFLEAMENPAVLYDDAPDILNEWKDSLKMITNESKQNREIFNSIIKDNFGE